MHSPRILQTTILQILAAPRLGKVVGLSEDYSGGIGTLPGLHVYTSNTDCEVMEVSPMQVGDYVDTLLLPSTGMQAATVRWVPGPAEIVGVSQCA